MTEGMPNCAPVLLEPIMHVRIHVPNDATAKVNAIVSGRRGQLMGFDARDGWRGWDTVEAQMPMSELHGLIIDLRSLTQGRRHLRDQVRSSGGADRQARRAGGGDAQGGGVARPATTEAQNRVAARLSGRR
jgi:predicted membrane GTPase involved in stress response